MSLRKGIGFCQQSEVGFCLPTMWTKRPYGTVVPSGLQLCGLSVLIYFTKI